MAKRNWSKATIIKRLSKRFPDIDGICDGEEGGWGDCIHLGDCAEGGTIDGVEACNSYWWEQDPKEETWEAGVHKALVAELDKYGFYAECYDNGTYLAYRK